MTINGIPSAYSNAGLVPGLGRSQEAEQVAPRETRAQPTTQPAPQATSHALAETRGAVPAEAPPGTDPALWQVLTPEERSFFARARTMGPLTYGPGSARGGKVPGVLQGGRIDVRV
jgi:hypothetical protein